MRIKERRGRSRSSLHNELPNIRQPQLTSLQIESSFGVWAGRVPQVCVDLRWRLAAGRKGATLGVYSVWSVWIRILIYSGPDHPDRPVNQFDFGRLAVDACQRTRVAGHVIWGFSMSTSGADPQRVTNDKGACLINFQEPKFGQQLVV